MKFVKISKYQFTSFRRENSIVFALRTLTK